MGLRKPSGRSPRRRVNHGRSSDRKPSPNRGLLDPPYVSPPRKAEESETERENGRGFRGKREKGKESRKGERREGRRKKEGTMIANKEAEIAGENAVISRGKI